MRHRKPEAGQTDLQADAKHSVEAVTKHLTEDELSKISVPARAIVKGLPDMAKEGTPEEVAARIALSIASLLSMMASVPVGNASDVIDHTIAGYAMAAGSLLDVYELPAAPEGSEDLMEQVKAALDEHSDETAVKYL